MVMHNPIGLKSFWNLKEKKLWIWKSMANFSK
jgi:hypothetical protein